MRDAAVSPLREPSAARNATGLVGKREEEKEVADLAKAEWASGRGGLQER